MERESSEWDWSSDDYNKDDKGYHEGEYEDYVDEE
jgi:hypothetical protein